jgi:hypothetical protein
MRSLFIGILKMQGSEYRHARKLLTRNLTGHTAFRTKDGKERWYAKHGTKKEAVEA